MAEFEAEREEQAMEAEALESIFMDDFEQISDSPFHWKVKLTPHPPGDEQENHGESCMILMRNGCARPCVSWLLRVVAP